MSCFLSIDGEKRGALCRSNVVLFMVQFYYNVSIENYGVSIPIARKHPFYWIEDLLACFGIILDNFCSHFKLVVQMLLFQNY
jgi:hypothetical protein